MPAGLSGIFPKQPVGALHKYGSTAAERRASYIRYIIPQISPSAMPAVFTHTMHREKRKSRFLSETCEIFVDLWGLGDKIYTYRWGRYRQPCRAILGARALACNHLDCLWAFFGPEQSSSPARKAGGKVFPAHCLTNSGKVQMCILPICRAVRLLCFGKRNSAERVP